MRVSYPKENSLTLSTGVVMVDMRLTTPEAIQDWYRWLLDNECFPVAGTSGGGMGRWYGSFLEEDGERVLGQLRNMFSDLEIA